MHRFVFVVCTTFVFAESIYAENSSTLDDSANLFFREDWQETPEQIPVTQEHVNNDELTMTKHGPNADMIKKSHHDNIPNDPWYIWSGMCRQGRWAISLRKRNALLDLSKGGRIRWRVKQSGQLGSGSASGGVEPVFLVSRGSKRRVAGVDDAEYLLRVHPAIKQWATLESMRCLRTTRCCR